MDYDDIKKIFFKFDPETAHMIAEFGMRFVDALPGGLSLFASKFAYENPTLCQKIWDQIFINPIGIGGGFDKNLTMARPLAALGFGFHEFGTFTPLAQKGNDKPRLFRLIKEQSIQNFMGFNNIGSEKIAKNASKLYPFCIPLFANIGKNKNTPNDEALKDYEVLISKFSQICSAFVINVSSPNTPNLRDLQNKTFIKELFELILKLTTKPIIFKISPDMEQKDAIDLCSYAVGCGAKGVIINNTSVDYTLSPNAKEFGGISGELIKERSRVLFQNVAKELFGYTTLISCGGIDTAQEAYERIKMGANLVEIFTSFIFKGPQICSIINSGIALRLEKDGFTNISEAVGADLKGFKSAS